MSSQLPSKKRAVQRKGSGSMVGVDPSAASSDAERGSKVLPLDAYAVPGFGRGTSLGPAMLGLAADAVPSTNARPSALHNAKGGASSSGSPGSTTLPAFPIDAPAPASAASMLRAAAAFAAEAGSSPAALAAMSDALLDQAQQQGAAKQRYRMASGSGGASPFGSPEASSPSQQYVPPVTGFAQGRRSSAGTSLRGYASGTNAQLSQAIARQQAVASSSGVGDSGAASKAGGRQRVPSRGLNGTLPFGTTQAGNLPDLVARAEMTDIAVRAAAQEAQAQGIVQEMIRSHSQGSDGSKASQHPGSASPDAATTAARRRSLKAFKASHEMSPQHTGGEIRAASEPSDAIVPPPVVDAYLSKLGLAHIQVPVVAPAASSFASSSTMQNPIHLPVPSSIAASLPYHQVSGALSGAFNGLNVTSPRSGGEAAHEGRRWDEADPVADLKLGGVPSMPLMPAPGLQMLPPPNSPAFLLDAFAKAASRWDQSRGGQHMRTAADATRSGGAPPRPTAHSASVGQAPAASSAINAPAADAAALISSFPFQVVQTPGGTARPGWWIPTSAVAEDEKAALDSRSKAPKNDNAAPRDAYFQPR